MLSDSCFDLNLGLKQGYDSVATVQGFIDDMRHYADPPFDYPKEVIDMLIELAGRWLASEEMRDLVVLLDAAGTVRRFYDCDFGGYTRETDGEWDLRVEKGEFSILRRGGVED